MFLELAKTLALRFALGARYSDIVAEYTVTVQQGVSEIVLEVPVELFYLLIISLSVCATVGLILPLRKHNSLFLCFSSSLSHLLSVSVDLSLQ